MQTNKTVFKKVLMFPGNVNCRVYDTPKYNIEVTLEDNLSTAIKSLRKARAENRAGVPNAEYLRWCKKNFKDAIELCRNTERVSCHA